MKRFWIGVGFLIALLAGSLFLLTFSSGFCREFSAALDEACALALEENWTPATEKVENCYKEWKNKQHLLAAFTDHEPIEQVESLFSQLALYSEKGMSVEFASTCCQLRHWADAISESHSLKWWTIL